MASNGDLLPGLVTDWGGFEQFVSELNRTATHVVVEHNVVLTDRVGVKRQIDVVIRYREGLVDHLIICECKYWKRNVPREKVDAFAQTVRELNASRGIMFSAAGFQEGAIETARANGMSLFKVREPTPGEWGLPGRYIDFYLVFVSRAVGQVQFPGAAALGPVADPNIHLDLHIGDARATTRALLPDGSETTIEDEIMKRSHDLAQKMFASEAASGVPFFGGGTGERRVWNWAATAYAPGPLIIEIQPKIALPQIRLQVGLHIVQSRIQRDRAANYTFTVALEDCVTSGVTGASRRPGDDLTSLFPLAEQTDTEGALQNGSSLVVWHTQLEPFDEFASLREAVRLDGPLPQHLQQG